MPVDIPTVTMHMMMTAAAHPLSYSKVLIQLGHEPMAPSWRSNAFFRKQLMYPSVFSYVGHIRKTDGFFGMYRGLTPRILANFATSITYVQVAKLIGFDKKREEIDSDADMKEVATRICQETTLEVVAKCCAVIVSQPFHVISIRMMGEFVGRETLYTNMWSSTKEIYQSEGILGFFAGLLPRLFGEMITVCLCNVLTHILNTYVLNKKNELTDLRQYSPAVTGFIVSSIVYPIQLTSTIMAASGSNLAIANPPLTPTFTGWLDCLSFIRKNNLTSRGSNMFFRKVVGHIAAASSVQPMPAPSFS